MPLVALLPTLQGHRRSLTGISDGIVGEIAEHAIEQAAIALHHDALRQLVDEGHLALLSFQGSLPGNVCHHLGNIHRLKIYHVGTIIQAVQCGNVTEQGGESLALSITTLQELCLHLVIDMRIVEDGLQITLDACHWGLQLMGDVLGKLSFQDVLFLSGGLDTLIHLDDTLGYLAQLIVRERSQVFYLQALVVVSLVGEDTKLGDVLAQSVGEAIEHDGQEDDGADGKPDVVLVSLQRLREVVVVWQGTADDDGVGREIGRHIEVVLLHRLRLAIDTGALSILQCFLDLLTVDVVGEMVIVLAHIVVHHLSIGAHQSDTQVLALVVSNEGGDDILIMVERQVLLQQGIVSLQLHRERTDLILFLTHLLEDDETDGEHEEHRQHRKIQLSTYS